ncbi:hypothetical protein [Sphingomonas abietis]|uniref:Uncharacterized protein n=1 Tax=Sphingomonas abietis TaxID=3012344 RepID=A0ABY7NS84_9SPHN|nr:hypothetical protein [Sphingomonas abietis]WBO24032.1 hypothetical protein PBT88_07965 [Sphingomonas abietis]
MIVRAVQKRVGVSRIGTIPATLLTTGASLALTRGRRPIGLALAGVGGLLLWQEIERERRLAADASRASEPLLPVPGLPPAASVDASAARARR